MPELDKLHLATMDPERVPSCPGVGTAAVQVDLPGLEQPQLEG